MEFGTFFNNSLNLDRGSTRIVNDVGRKVDVLGIILQKSLMAFALQ